MSKIVIVIWVHNFSFFHMDVSFGSHLEEGMLKTCNHWGLKMGSKNNQIEEEQPKGGWCM
jgi:hypothetical protein